MPTLLSQLETVNWGLSTAGLGQIVTDTDDIIQCIDLILSTTPGTDPLRPNFGSNIYLYQDIPVNEAVVNIVPEIINAVNNWETRATVQNIAYTITDLSNVQFNISLTTSIINQALLYTFNLYETSMTPYPVFYAENLVLQSVGASTSGSISGISTPGNDGGTLSFNPIASPIGLPLSMNLRVGSIASTIMAVVDYPSDYAGQPFAFTTPYGTRFTSNFPSGNGLGTAFNLILK
jgi:phage baseplate assembly protein W